MYPAHPKTDSEKPVTYADWRLLCDREAQNDAAMLGYMQRILETLDEGLLIHQPPFTFTKTLSAPASQVLIPAVGYRRRFFNINISANGGCQFALQLMGERLSGITVAGQDVCDVRPTNALATMANFAIVIPANTALWLNFIAGTSILVAIIGNLENIIESGTEEYRGRGF